MRKTKASARSAAGQTVAADTSCSIRVTPDTKNALKAIAAVRNVQMYSLVEELLGPGIEAGLKEVAALLPKSAGRKKPS